MNETTNHYLALMREADRATKQQAIEAFKVAAAANITKITVDFSGSGDEGDINEIEYYDGEEITEAPANDDDVKDACHCLLEEFVTIDWYNNDGGGGNLIIDLINFTVISDVYYMDTVTVPTKVHSLNLQKS